MNDEPYLINLGNYQISFRHDENGIITMEVHTNLESVSKENYAKIMMNVVQYMGDEGFFDGWIPQQLSIYDKFGQIVPVQNLS